MRPFTIILICVIFISFQATAQESSRYFFEEMNYWDETDWISGNSMIEQLGNRNDVVVIQQTEGMISNQVNLQQLKDQNVAYVKQVGTANFTYLLQSGIGNEANLWSVGDYTSTSVFQEGNTNIINSYIDNQGMLFKSAVLIQQGNHNNIELALTGNGYLAQGYPKAAYIQQSGNNLEVIAKLDSYESPILIRQQSGMSNKGMSVTISNTDFYFPKK